MTKARSSADFAAGGPSVAGKNYIINGGMDIWQRGTSIAGTSKGYTADRWSVYTSGGGVQSSSYTVTRQSTSDTTNLPFIQYCARFQRNSGSTSTNLFFFAQSFETVNSIPLAGRTVTISFYARKGANYSPTSSLLNIEVASDTGTNQYFADYSTYTDAINQNATLTTTWQRFSYTGTFATNANEVAVFFNATPTGTAGANDYFEITGVQLEIGQSATPFSRAGGTIQGELAACQRYYFLKASGANQSFGMAAYNSASDIRGSFGFPVEMRVVPTMVSTSGTNYYRVAGITDYFDSLTLWQASTKETAWYNVSQASGTTGQGGVVWTDNASASIALSAEL